MLCSPIILGTSTNDHSRYGDVMPTSLQQRTWKMEPFDPKAPGPYVTFIFRYRSKGELYLHTVLMKNQPRSGHRLARLSRHHQ